MSTGDKGRVAFEAYQKDKGLTTPRWEQLTPETKSAWCAAAMAVLSPGKAVYGSKCHRCIDYRPGDKCAHSTCEHPEIANPPDFAGLAGLAARTSRA
jgi:hypothetical protein